MISIHDFPYLARGWREPKEALYVPETKQAEKKNH